MKFAKLRFFYLHAQRRHGIEFSAMMTGAKKCFLSNPSTGRICGMRFDRKDHLVRHQNGADCLSNRGKPETPPHLQGCTFVFDDKRICGKTFKQSKDYTRHLLAKSHGGPGARGHSGGVSQVYIWNCISQYLFSISQATAKSGLLNPITSDKSSESGKSSEKGKLVTNYSCPFAPSCNFTLTKAEMREMTKASQHLIKEHKVTSEDTKAAIAAKNQKYKFGKLKQMPA